MPILCEFTKNEHTQPSPEYLTPNSPAIGTAVFLTRALVLNMAGHMLLLTEFTVAQVGYEIERFCIIVPTSCTIT